MRLIFDCPTSQSTDALHVSNLPLIAPAATDTVIVITPTGTALVPIGNLGASSGDGTPEASITASPGATYWDSTNKILYVKDTGTGNTGWLSL